MVKMAEKPKKSAGGRWLPILGVILAVIFGILAWVLSVPVMDFLADNGIYREGFLAKQFGSNAPLIEQLIIAGLLFFITFSLMGFLISLLAGRSYDEQSNIQFRKDTVKRKAAMERERLEKRERRQRRNRNVE